MKENKTKSDPSEQIEYDNNGKIITNIENLIATYKDFLNHLKEKRTSSPPDLNLYSPSALHQHSQLDGIKELIKIEFKEQCTKALRDNNLLRTHGSIETYRLKANTSEFKRLLRYDDYSENLLTDKAAPMRPIIWNIEQIQKQSLGSHHTISQSSSSSSSSSSHSSAMPASSSSGYITLALDSKRHSSVPTYTELLRIYSTFISELTTLSGPPTINLTNFETIHITPEDQILYGLNTIRTEHDSIGDLIASTIIQKHNSISYNQAARILLLDSANKEQAKQFLLEINHDKNQLGLLLLYAENFWNPVLVEKAQKLIKSGLAALEASAQKLINKYPDLAPVVTTHLSDSKVTTTLTTPSPASDSSSASSLINTVMPAKADSEDGARDDDDEEEEEADKELLQALNLSKELAGIFSSSSSTSTATSTIAPSSPDQPNDSEPNVEKPPF